MRILNLEQGSPDWHKIRKNSIGASDSPSIMGCSPWTNIHELWDQKLGHGKKKSSAAMQRGHDLEPIARTMFELKTMQDWPPIVAQDEVHDFLIASLDGWNGSEVLEIKCPGGKDHAIAVQGNIPEKYFPQLQHQMLVTGADVCHYVSYSGSAIVHIEVKKNLDYICELLRRCIRFQELVNQKIKPRMEDFQKWIAPKLCQNVL